MRSFHAAATLVATVALCAAAAAPLPPVLPQHFEGHFTEYTAKTTRPPPFVNGIPDAPFFASRGRTFYDWARKALIEERLDDCVNIFPAVPNTFPCTFHNTNGTSYLLSFNTTALPPCCVFGDPWYPPPPAFLRTRVASILNATNVPWGGAGGSGLTTWFINTDVPPPAGPFYWSFTQRLNGTLAPEAIYDSFSFPGIEGWVQQNFHRMSTKATPAHMWDVPAACKKTPLPNCGFFGAGKRQGQM
jgi:hypothetical protein